MPSCVYSIKLRVFVFCLLSVVFTGPMPVNVSLNINAVKDKLLQEWSKGERNCALGSDIMVVSLLLHPTGRLSAAQRVATKLALTQYYFTGSPPIKGSGKKKRRCHLLHFYRRL
jgi:hypothetical protein